MEHAHKPIIEMTSSGAFVDPPRPGLGTIVRRIALFGVLLVVAAVAFWAALFIIPVLLVLGIIGYFVARQQMRRGNVVVMVRPGRTRRDR